MLLLLFVCGRELSRHLAAPHFHREKAKKRISSRRELYNR